MIDELVAARTTLSFETTLAARSYRTSILEWRQFEYRDSQRAGPYRPYEKARR